MRTITLHTIINNKKAELKRLKQSLNTLRTKWRIEVLQDEIEKLEAALPKNKYNARKVVIDGITFDSTAEAVRYSELLLLLRAKEIKCLTLQPVFILPGGIKYIADFEVLDNQGNHWIEDVKGFKTQTYELKKKLFKEKYPNLTLVEIK